MGKINYSIVVDRKAGRTITSGSVYVVVQVYEEAYAATTPTVSTKPRCHANMKHWTHQHALLVQKDFLPLFHPKPKWMSVF